MPVDDNLAPSTPTYGWDEFKHKQINIQQLLDYKTSVWAATNAYLSALTIEELDRKVKFAVENAQ